MDGLWRWKPGPAEFHAVPGALDSVGCFDEGHDDGLLICTRTGIQRLVHGKREPYRLPGFVGQFQPERMLRDREGGLWIAARGRGLLHVHKGRTDEFARPDGLSGDGVWGLLEDREGSIWAATDGGLDRFRDVAVTTFTENQGLSSSEVGSVLAATDGSVWLSTLRGLNRWNAGQITAVNVGNARRDGQLNGNFPGSLFQDTHGRMWLSVPSGVGYLQNNRFVSVSDAPAWSVHDIVEDSQGSLWIADQVNGLLRVARDGTLDRIPWERVGRKDFPYALAADPVHGGVWIGFYQGGVAYLSDLQVGASYEAVNGLGEGRVNGLRFDHDGTLWVATEGGLSRIRGGRVATMTTRNGLPCDAVNWEIEDDANSSWLYMPCGLVRIARSELDAWGAAVDNAHDAARTVRVTVLDSSDGVRSLAAAGGYTPRVTKAPDGRLWFGGNDGASVVDPAHLPFNKLAPPVHIEQIKVDRAAHDVDSAEPRSIGLPALTRDFEIDYTALSLVVPEKNRYRVKLEGWDADWVDMGNGRQKFYSNLPPRPYRFHVIASNNSGVWNETGDVLEFSIAPAWYQRISFRTAVVVGFFSLVWALIRYRERQIAHVYDTRVQARVDERTRIARELHDTLLQSFHGLLFRFQAATNKLPDSQAKQELERTIDQAAQAITEGRDAVQGLRGSTVLTNDLAEALGTLGAELANDHTGEADRRAPVVDVVVEGATRDLHPVVRDDIYRIAGEALRNAFRHSGARRIEVRIHYDDRQLRVEVRDDGKGIDQTRVEEDRPGHFGLRGMRERAGVIGGRLEVWSEVRLGTEVALTVPAAAAYAAPRARGWFRWFARRTGTES